MKRRNALAILASSVGLFLNQNINSDKSVARLKWKPRPPENSVTFQGSEPSTPVTLQLNLHNLEAIEIYYNDEKKVISPRELFDAL